MPDVMRTKRREMDFAIEVFVRGHSVGKSRTFLYEASRVGPLWVMRDAPRKNPRDYRKEEWIAHASTPVRWMPSPAATRAAGSSCARWSAKASRRTDAIRLQGLGYRLIATEGFFVQRLTRIPKSPSPVAIERVHTPEMAARLGKATRTRPMADNLLGEDAPFRQYVALDGEDIVGRVRSVDAAGATWCADMYVNPSHRRRGIGQALLEPDAAGRPGARLEVLGAHGKPHRRASLSAHGL